MRHGHEWVGLMLGITIVALLAAPSSLASPGARPAPAGPPAPALPGDWSDWSPILYREPGLGLGVGPGAPPPATTVLEITVTLPFSNLGALGNLLAQLDQPTSPAYRQYLTAAEFDAEFGGSSERYQAWEEYLQPLGATGVTLYGDRATLTFEATPAVAGAIFHVPILEYHDALGRSFYAPSTAPRVPQPLAVGGAFVDGLSSYPRFVISTEGFGGIGHAPRIPTVHASPVIDGYPAPVTVGGVQDQFASDYQVAYDQLSLFQEYGYPTDAVAATILWTGNYTGPPVSTPYGNLTDNEGVGPFDPNDLQTFYNETLPAGQPHPTVFGAPLDGASAPGPLASWDGTGAVLENTLDLEDLGSLAPGATIYNVYGPGSSYAGLDQAFAYILSPNATTPGLANVSVISNSWAAAEINDSGWYQDLEEAQSRGITVLAISGDSGDSPASSWGVGNAFYPGSMAFDNFGDVAVGGTTNILSGSTLSLLHQTAWYDASHLGGPVGSTGGISPTFAEPSWQSSTSANSVLNGAGRGVPDVAAVANNSLMTLTIDGYQYQATNASVNPDYYFAWGTSVATPVEAGIVADIDHVLQHSGNGWLGFLDPTLYPLASEEDAALPGNATVGFYNGPQYDSILPTLPLDDVVRGKNAHYQAATGYDLVTGWGSLDAYNLTMYYLTLPSTPTPGQWTGVQAALNLSGLEVTSSYPGYGINTYANASIQQNFFVADSLGAPIYWVQNVVYIFGVPGDWQMNYTGWLVYPFYGTEPALVMYEYNAPVTDVTEVPPVNFTFRTQILPGTGFDSQQIEFSFGTPGAPPLYLPAPGASYIIGNWSYNYSWMGAEYSNGPYPEPAGGPGGLDPQFGLVGGPSGYIGNYGPGTTGTAELTYSTGGPYLPGQTRAFGYSIDQTGEAASNLTWMESDVGDPAVGIPSTWSFGYLNGAAQQGIVESQPTTLPATSNLSVTETGLPTGTTWGITFPGAGEFTAVAPSSIEARLFNGTYSYHADPPAGYYAVEGSGSVNVTGTGNPTIDLVFAVLEYNVTISESGLPTGTSWWFNTSSASSEGAANGAIVLAFPNGSYSYGAAAAGAWVASPVSGVLTVNGADRTFAVRFVPAPRYQATFEEDGLLAADAWTVTVDSNSTSGTAGTPLALSLPNGTFSWTATTPDGDLRSTLAPGLVDIAGAPTIVNVTFDPVTFPVTFVTAGLPDGNLWSLEEAGQTSVSLEASQAVVLPLPNGTNPYAPLSANPEYAGTAGSVTVAGAPVTVVIPFVQVEFLVTVSLAGLPNGSLWSLTFNGTVEAGLTASSTASFLEPNGSYAYSVGVPPGYTAAPSSGSITVNGVDVAVVVQVAPAAGGSQFLGGNGWVGVALVAVVAIGVVGFLLRSRLKRRTGNPSPPPSAPVGTADGDLPPVGGGGH